MISKRNDTCLCEYISPGAAALHAVFHGIDRPLPKVRNPLCPIHGDGPHNPEVFTMEEWRRNNDE